MDVFSHAAAAAACRSAWCFDVTVVVVRNAGLTSGIICPIFHQSRALTLTLIVTRKGKASPYSITERGVPELIPVLGSQPAGDVSHKPDGRLPLLSTRPAVTRAALKRSATSFAAW